MTGRAAQRTGRRSAGDHVDVHRGAVGQHVIYRRPVAGLLHDPAQRRVVGIPFDVEGDLDLLIAVADRPIGQPQDAQQIDVALDGRA